MKLNPNVADVLKARSDRRKVEIAARRLLRAVEGGRINLEDAVAGMRRALLEVRD